MPKIEFEIPETPLLNAALEIIVKHSTNSMKVYQSGSWEKFNLNRNLYVSESRNRVTSLEYVRGGKFGSPNSIFSSRPHYECLSFNDIPKGNLYRLSIKRENDNIDVLNVNASSCIYNNLMMDYYGTNDVHENVIKFHVFDPLPDRALEQARFAIAAANEFFGNYKVKT